MVKNLPCNAGDPDSFLGEFYGQRSLVGYSPWACRESDTTEQLMASYLHTKQYSLVCCSCYCEVASVVSDSVQHHRRQPTRLPVPGILQARTLEWIAISFSNAWKWKVKVKLLSGVQLLATPCTAAYQTPPSLEFSGQEYWSGSPLPSPYSLLSLA